MKKILCIFLILSILLIYGCKKTALIDVKELVIATIPEKYYNLSNITLLRFIDSSLYAFSPNGERVAYRVRYGGKEIVIVDNKEDRPYDELNYYYGFLVFSPDSQQIAYVAKQNEKYFLVLNGKEGK